MPRVLLPKTGCWSLVFAVLLPLATLAGSQDPPLEILTPVAIRKIAKEVPGMPPTSQKVTLSLLKEVASRPIDPTLDVIETLNANRDAGLTLCEQFKPQNPEIQILWIKTIGQLRAPGENAVPIWHQALQSKQLSLIEASSESIMEYFNRIKDLRECNTSTPAARSRVLELYAQDLIQTLPIVSEMLTINQRKVRLNACKALAGMAKTFDSLPQEYRFDPNHYAQFKKILPELVSRLENALQHYVQLLNDEDMSIRLEILNTLEPILELSVQREEVALRNPLFRRGRLWQREFEPQGSEAANRLNALSMKFRKGLAAQFPNSTLEVRMATLRVYENLTNSDPLMIEGLIKATKDENQFVRWAAVRVLGNQKPVAYPEAIASMIRLLKDSDFGVRMAACQALGQQGANGKAAAKELGRCLNEGDEDVKYQALWALNQMAPEALDALPDIIKALKSKDVRIREEVPALLAKMGKPAANQSVPALMNALQDEDANVRYKAAMALRTLLEIQ